MLSKKVFHSLFIGLIVLASCQKAGSSYTISSPADADNFVALEEKKNTYEKKIKDVNYKIKYISNEQMVLQQVQDLSKINQMQFDSIVKNYDSLLFFNLEIAIDNFNEELLKYKLSGNIDASYNDRVEYYAFKMQKDICIVLAEKDTVPCIMYHFERSYGLSPKNEFMLGFKTSTLKNAVFVYDNKLLNTGTVKIALNEQDILRHPQIKIN